jgi:hypothetical protein
MRPGVIRFTHEVEENGKLPFLDVMVSRVENGSLSFGVYRKPTHTNQLLNYTSHHRVSVKRSVVNTLFKRLEAIPSDENTKREERLCGKFL